MSELNWNVSERIMNWMGFRKAGKNVSELNWNVSERIVKFQNTGWTYRNVAERIRTEPIILTNKFEGGGVREQPKSERYVSKALIKIGSSKPCGRTEVLPVLNVFPVCTASWGSHRVSGVVETRSAAAVTISIDRSPVHGLTAEYPTPQGLSHGYSLAG